MKTHFQKAVRRSPNRGLSRTRGTGEHNIAAGFKYDRHSPRKCVDGHIFRLPQACVASAVGSAPAQYDLGASQGSVCEERLQDSGQRVEDVSVGGHLTLTFNIIETRAHPILICLAQVGHKRLAIATAATAPNTAGLAANPSTGQISQAYSPASHGLRFLCPILGVQGAMQFYAKHKTSTFSL
jgi:hypothetical protein